jgi:signal peptidase I
MAAALALALSPLLAVHPVTIQGRSMEPLLKGGQHRWVLRAWCAGRPAAREVWLVATPTGPAVKRIVALPGSRVELQDGHLRVDSQPIEEPYVVRGERASGGPWATGAGYFLLGDNRPDSHDSRAWGPVPAASLQGRVLWTDQR